MIDSADPDRQRRSPSRRRRAQAEGDTPLRRFLLSRLSESPNRRDREYTAETERWSTEEIASTVWPESAIDFSRSSSAIVQFLQMRRRRFIALKSTSSKMGRWPVRQHCFRASALAMMV